MEPSRGTPQEPDRPEHAAIPPQPSGGPPPPDEAMLHAPVRADIALTVRLAAIALVGLALFVALYVLAVRTPEGQRLGNAALAGQRVMLERGTSGAERVLGWIGTASLAAGTFALVVVALIRRRPRLALATAITVVGSVLISIVLKSVFLDRPTLADATGLPVHNSFPSGHATAAAAVAAGLVLVAPSILRGKVGVLGAIYAAAVAYATVAAGWHRPSDVAGSSAIVLAAAALSSAWLVGTGYGRRIQREPGHRGRSPIAATALLSAGAALILAGFLGMAGPIEAVGSGLPLTEPLQDATFIALSTASVGVTVFTLALLVLGLHGVELDPPEPRRGGPDLQLHRA
jgi:membrane-associated phospholipid phosphatase